MRGTMPRPPGFFAILAITVCGRAPGTNPTNASIAGRYNPRTVIGADVPATVVLDSVSTTVD